MTYALTRDAADECDEVADMLAREDRKREARQREAREAASREWDEAVAAWDVDAKLEGGTLSHQLGECITDWDRVYTALMRGATNGDFTCKRILADAKESYMRQHSSGDAA